MLSKILNRETNKIKKSAYIWNFMSSIAKAIQLTIFLALISRATTQSDAGIMSLAFSVAYLMRTIGDYAMRNFQVTDTRGKFGFPEYFTSRIITLLLMIVCSVLYIYAKDYNFDKAITILLICFYMGVDAIEDVFHGEFQQLDRLDIAAFTEFIRYVCGMLVFGIALFISRKLWLSTLVLTCFSIVLFVILNFPFIREFVQVKMSADKAKVGRLLWECFPLFIGVFLSAFINNAPKDAIDRVLNDELQGYFGMIFMPAFVVNLFSAVVYRPITVELARECELKRQQYVKNIKKQYLIIAGIMLVCVIGAFAVGIPVLSLLYQVPLAEYKLCLIILMIGGGVSAAISFSGVLLTIQRKQKTMYYAYGIAMFLSILFSIYFVRRWNILGASILYVILNIVILLIMFITISIDNFRKMSVIKSYINEKGDEYCEEIH